jgi:two-component system, cell cycle sensor histidine kinase and response regulator CckA
VLVVDDEDDIRTVTSAMIDSLGYRTLEAAAGVQALEIFDREEGAIDLVLLDLTMPGVGGIEIYERLRERSPHLAVLLCSGYSLDAEATHLLEDGRTGFLQKPYDRTALSLRLREMLGER